MTDRGPPRGLGWEHGTSPVAAGAGRLPATEVTGVINGDSAARRAPSGRRFDAGHVFVTFANPPGNHAWRLIDEAGCRGLVRGGAMVSEKHTNFLINTGSASAADIEGLGEEVRRRVHAESGIVLEWEIRRVGRPLEN